MPVDDNPHRPRLDRPAGAAARRGHAASGRRLPARKPRDKIARLQAAIAENEGRCRRARARPIPSPGPSTSAAPTSPTIRWRWPSRILPDERQADALHRRAEALQQRPRRARRSRRDPRAGRVRRRASPRSAMPARRCCSTRQATAAAIAAAIRDAGGTVVEGADPAVLPKARKNPTELAGARRAHLRDGAAMVRFLAWLDRDGAGRHGRRDRGGGAARRLPRRDRAPRRLGAGRPVLRHHLRRRAERRHRPLPRHAGDQPPARAGHALPGRFRRPVSRRHHRHHPHRRRSARRRAEMRDRFTRVLKGHIALATARFPAGTTGAQLDTLARHRAVAGRARLRPRHRPRRRLLPRRARGAGAHLQARHRAARAGHDPLQRARLLQDRRLRHPHREPGRGDAGRRRSPAATGRCSASRR